MSLLDLGCVEDVFSDLDGVEGPLNVTDHLLDEDLVLDLRLHTEEIFE